MKGVVGGVAAMESICLRACRCRGPGAPRSAPGSDYQLVAAVIGGFASESRCRLSFRLFRERQRRMVARQLSPSTRRLVLAETAQSSIIASAPPPRLGELPAPSDLRLVDLLGSRRLATDHHAGRVRERRP
jgi:hypothetical protein